MKFRYIYQQFFSHISIIIVAFLVLSLLFAHYVENLVYENKANELISYGKSIMSEIEQRPQATESIINRYSSVLATRKMSFSMFDQYGKLYAVGKQGPAIGGLSDKDWDKISKGRTLVVNSDFKRFGQEGVTFVVLPYLDNGNFIGGILLTSPISGSSAMIQRVNQFILYTILIALIVSFLMSWFLSRIHVNRIKRLREATSLVSAGNYQVHVSASNFDEIGELANDFNHMVDKINTSMEEIESLENRRRQFLSDVSHEMRTPLTTISGVIEGLKNDMIPEEDKERGINLVSQEAKRLIRLVNENLDYDKIRSNQIQLFREDIQLVELLEIIQEQLMPQAEDKNNRIVIDAAPEVMVNADYDRLIQILINITKNSIQFTTNGTIWLRGRTEENSTIIEVEDTGIGIDPNDIENIWRRFYKADISRTSNPYGEFGLGLSIVKQLVLLHNGEINVFSEEGQGTKFVIRLQK
ncbi:HAMP domain-containing histidine kinase [Bacillus sp. ISL-40]|uniref:sensor histidine kinase n=1 Tax=unclassified Bacillus (in: firmicutes) TaxID=185979 RepID=UPI001BE664FA|nr:MULTISPECIES: HAMP domain-containing sensor histidine kinase [unclassified Bacillus (in: firmicutes)]MBT2699689.1 HAMP domain-containing histidine kinase [Bacillus sp. ISL-40]MBT2723598.1 HAMP domain-containing histidine kinase [Bacillus sp. ISL-46]MBT2744309.1 HAMP domain-containing histidine kinase [Bacillus sp. ISL-77]